MTLVQNDEGRVVASLDLDALTGEELLTALDPLCRPIPLPDGSPDPRPVGKRRADALGQLVRTYLSHSRRPMSGGVLPHVTLIRPQAPGFVDTLGFTGPISAATADLITCDSTLGTVIVDGNGAPLDVGRSERLFTPAIRKGLAVRDGGCAHPGCGRPVSWCDAHHIIPWGSDGNDQHRQRRAAVPTPPHRHPSRRLASLFGPRPPPLVHPTPQTGRSRTGTPALPRPTHHDRPTHRRLTKPSAHLDNYTVKPHRQHGSGER